MNEATLIFPHQLFENHPAIRKHRKVMMIEDQLFFSQYDFHIQKLVLHRASMKHYEAELASKGFTVDYVDAQQASLEKIFKTLADQNVSIVHLADAEDYLLNRRITRYAKRHSIQVKVYPSPNFINSKDAIDEYFASKKRYFMNDFYIDQRKRYNVMISQGEPLGGKWSFDTENRKKMPASVIIPPLPTLQNKETIEEAATYISKHFVNTYGEFRSSLYVTTRQEAIDAFDIFLKQRFQLYGVYQDAIVSSNSFLFHSVLTPALNIGLISPIEILDRAIEFAERKHIPINSLEGFVRQILGWREYMRAMYHREGVRQRTSNYWEHTHKVPKKFWQANTGIDPVDVVIRKVLSTGYCNHIERLMVMGNFMFLCEFDPNEVYRWFMELFIDSYDWVMVPNVYGMSQNAAGGLIATKPYISGSNYILKMSNYKKGPWAEVWDSLYWSFIDKHKQVLLKNPRMSMMVRLLEKMDVDQIKRYRKQKDKFLTSIL